MHGVAFQLAAWFLTPVLAPFHPHRKQRRQQKLQEQMRRNRQLATRRTRSAVPVARRQVQQARRSR